MKKLIIVIERANNSFAAYAENCNGVYGMGQTAEEAKTSALKGLELFIKNNSNENLPEILKSRYEIEYKHLDK